MGLLSKITPRFLKTTIRKVGKAIKWATKPIRKVLRKVLKPIGKAMDKLGWVGTLALMIWGGPIASWFGSWMGPMATSFMSAMPQGVSTFLKTIGNGITKAANFGKTVYNSITSVFKQGLNKIGQAFGMADPGKLVMSKTGEGLILKDPATWGAKATLKQKTLTGALDEWVHRSILGQKDYQSSPLSSTSLSDATRQEVWSPEELEFKVPEVKPITGVDVAVDAIDPVTKLPVGMEEIKPTLNFEDAKWKDPSLLAPEKSRWQQWQERRKTPLKDFYDDTFDPKVEAYKKSTIGKTIKYGTSGYGAYAAIRGTPDYEQPFYNENIGISNAMLQQTEQPTYMDTLAFTGDSAQPTDTFTTLAERYLTGFGYAPPTGQTDYFNHAMQMPGYGYTFDQYLYDNAGNYG